MRWFIFVTLLLGGCDNLYYRDMDPSRDMEVTIIVHTNPDTLWEACGDAKACSIRTSASCTVHIPERAGYILDHEITHCFGREDMPQVAVTQ